MALAFQMLLWVIVKSQEVDTIEKYITVFAWYLVNEGKQTVESNVSARTAYAYSNVNILTVVRQSLNLHVQILNGHIPLNIALNFTGKLMQSVLIELEFNTEESVGQNRNPRDIPMQFRPVIQTYFLLASEYSSEW